MKIEFLYNLPVARSMAFEKLFHRNLAFGYREKCALLRLQKVKVWMLVNGKLAGESYGMDLGDSDERIEGTLRYTATPNVLYVYSTAILRPFQCAGLSKILKAHLLGIARGKGYRTIIGHALEGPSLGLNVGFGARVIDRFENWYGTGRTAFLYELTQ